MKGYLSVFFLLALTTVAHAFIKDTSILDEDPGCESKLVVKVNGFGTDFFETEARKKCEDECDKGIKDFKEKRCFELCGQSDDRDDDDDDNGEICNLCYPDKDEDIDRCQSAMTLQSEGASGAAGTIVHVLLAAARK